MAVRRRRTHKREEMDTHTSESAKYIQARGPPPHLLGCMIYCHSFCCLGINTKCKRSETYNIISVKCLIRLWTEVMLKQAEQLPLCLRTQSKEGSHCYLSQCLDEPTCSHSPGLCLLQAYHRPLVVRGKPMRCKCLQTHAAERLLSKLKTLTKFLGPALCGDVFWEPQDIESLLFTKNTFLDGAEWSGTSINHCKMRRKT